MSNEKKTVNTEEIVANINELVEKGRQAYEAFKKLDQETVDRMCKEMTLAALEAHRELAKDAVTETGMGIYEDKITKNMFASEYVYNDIKKLKTVGIINETDTYMEVAEPIGVIAGVVPTTNPTSTTIFKSLIAMKTRNPIIFSFHPRAKKCSAKAATIVRDAAIKAGAPADCIQWVENPSVQGSQALMNHENVGLVLATGGPAMVASAYSTGKPALGVGAGNVPCYIEKTANVRRAVNDLIMSKTFDNGTVCASEQAVILDKEIAQEAKELFATQGCYFLKGDEKQKVEDTAIDKERGSMNPAIVGQPATKIAEMAGVKVPANTKILIAEIEGVGSEYPLSREKLSPVLAMFTVESTDAGITKAEEMIEFGGLGHSAVIHSNNKQIVEEFSERVKVSRIMVNTPSTHGAIGDLYNQLTPSLTLGCGTMGHNSTTENVSAMNLVNVKRVAKRRTNMQWFRVPDRIYYEAGSIAYLEKLGAKKAFIVTDRIMDQLGYVAKVKAHLEAAGTVVEVFNDVEPDPSVDTVMAGAEQMRKFQPDAIIALGGGSPMDAAKGMWLFYEDPTADFGGLKLKFMDIRKKSYKYPKLGNKARMVAIPTTSGTGSEVTAFAVITDKKENIKYPLADYALTPDVAIIDPELVMSVPAAVTADTGLDVLTHAIESYVSILASDYTKPLSLQAIKLVFDYLEKAYVDGSDVVAREKMHNASCMAGMAFSNAFLGINHSIAHKLGAAFHIPHGRSNAVILTNVIEYNADPNPTKFAAFPKYEYHMAPERYQDIARYLGLPAATPEEGVKSLVNAIKELMQKLNMPMTLEACGVTKEVLEAQVDQLADDAYEDQCTGANPRQPLVKELKEIILKSF